MKRHVFITRQKKKGKEIDDVFTCIRKLCLLSAKKTPLNYDLIAFYKFALVYQSVYSFNCFFLIQS